MKGNDSMNKKNTFFVYILICSDNSLYTGYTINDIGKRVEAHNNGTGAKYTRGRRPVSLVYFEEFTSKSEALRREFEIKSYSKSRKEILIKNL